MPPFRTSRQSPPRRHAICVFVLLCLALLSVGCPTSEPNLTELRQQQEQGDHAGTLDALRELLSLRPDDPEVNFLYGRALIASGQPTPATWPLREAMKHPDWRLAAGLQIAQAALTTGDFNEVVEVTTELLEDDPEQTHVLLLRAQAHAHWKKDPAAGLSDASRVLELDPTLIAAYEPQILSLLALDRHGEATEVLEEAGRRLVELDAPEDRLAWHCSTMAIFAEEAGEPELARERFAECLARFPLDPSVLTSALHFHDARGELAHSIELLEEALARKPEARFFRTSLASRLQLAGRPDEGEALLYEATEDPNPRLAARAWSDIAKFHHAMREHAEAAVALGRAVHLMSEVAEPGPQLRFEHADALLISGQLERALIVAEEISVPAQRELIRGRVAQERGDAASALESFDEALRLWPDNPWARYYAALAAEQLGDFDRALEEYRYAIRISVGATDARTRAAELLVEQGEPLRAYQLLFLEVSKAPLEPEGQLLSMYLMGRVANPTQLQQSLLALSVSHPERLPSALARGAEGAAEAAGPAAALSLLASAPGIDYTHPAHAPALRALVRHAHAAGQPAVAEQALAAALAAHPETAVFHELQALDLFLGDAPPGEVRKAYERALALDGGNAEALAGLGRIRVADDPGAAVELFERAVDANPEDAEVALEAARAQVAAGRNAAARDRLSRLLVEVPTLGAAAAELAALDLAQGRVDEKTLERARRAARFVRDAPSYVALGRVYGALGRPDEAAEARRAAAFLRERELRRDALEPQPSPEPDSPTG